MTMDSFYYNAEIKYIVEIMKNRLYFGITEGVVPKILKNTQDTVYFCIDEELIYINYYSDFGPLNISCLYKYCCKVNNLLCDQSIRKIVHYTTSDPNKRVNSAYLMGSFAIIYLNMDPRQIYKILLNAGGVYRNFVDASQGLSQYTIRLSDCLQAIAKAVMFNFINFSDFNVVEYDTHDKLQNGDMNWLIPRKFLAFIGPTENEILSGHPPDFYLKYFLKNDIKTVIRLNSKSYDSMVFCDVGIDHHDLFFPDGTTPPKEILMKFLVITENAPAAIAVHCKAGLGRTGSLIGAYIVKHYRMTAREAIAWMRICRPGSVIGQQQGWLEKVESWLWRQGSHYRLQHYGEGDKIPHHRYGIYSLQWPKERERLIKISQKRKAVQSLKNLSSKLNNETPQEEDADPSKVRHHKFEKKKILFDKKEEEFKKISRILNKVKDSNTSNQEEKETRPPHKSYENDVENLKPRKRRSRSSFQTETNLTRQHVQPRYNSHIPKKISPEIADTKRNFSAQTHDSNTKTNDYRFKKQYYNAFDEGHVYTALNHRGHRKNTTNNYYEEYKARRQIHTPDKVEMTQGDRLNSIKARRRANIDYNNQ